VAHQRLQHRLEDRTRFSILHDAGCLAKEQWNERARDAGTYNRLMDRLVAADGVTEKRLKAARLLWATD